MIEISAHISRNALRMAGTEGVDALCSWWDAHAPAHHQGAGHLGIYIGQDYG